MASFVPYYCQNQNHVMIRKAKVQCDELFTLKYKTDLWCIFYMTNQNSLMIQKEQSIRRDARFWIAMAFFGALLIFLVVTYPQ